MRENSTGDITSVTLTSVGGTHRMVAELHALVSPGNFYVYGRLAGGAGPFSGPTLSLVTNGFGTTNPDDPALGSFADPNAAGWQTWHWVHPCWIPITVPQSFLWAVPRSGDQWASLNANYYMLAPAAFRSTLSISMNAGNPSLSFATQAGPNYTVLYKNSLTDPTWKASQLSTATALMKTITRMGRVAHQRFYKSDGSSSRWNHGPAPALGWQRQQQVTR